jgi:hypothetical protein
MTRTVAGVPGIRPELEVKGRHNRYGPVGLFRFMLAKRVLLCSPQLGGRAVRHFVNEFHGFQPKGGMPVLFDGFFLVTDRGVDPPAILWFGPDQTDEFALACRSLSNSPTAIINLRSVLRELQERLKSWDKREEFHPTSKIGARVKQTLTALEEFRSV